MYGSCGPQWIAAQRVLVEAADEQDELRVAARWVRKFLQEQPEAKVAVIVPALEKQRREIDRVFREVLSPELEDIRANSESGPYEFSLGVRLAETPMVATALDLLRWAAGPLPLERVSGLLLSRYFAMTSEERGPRAEFDAFELRKTRMLRPEMTLDGLFAAVNGSKRKFELPRLLAALRAMRTVATRIQGMTVRAHAEWAEAMRELLAVAAWGSGSQETSVEFQTRRKWESALDELATLDFDGAQVEFVQALEGLERIARQTTFAPESRDAPVQVMGPLEAAGGSFDAVWFLAGGGFELACRHGSESAGAVGDAAGAWNAGGRCGSRRRAGSANHGARGGEREDGGVQLREGVDGRATESVAGVGGAEAGSDSGAGTAHVRRALA